MRFTTLAAGLSATVLMLSSASAQSAPRSTPISVSRGSFAIAPYGGYLVSQKFVEGPLDSSLGVNSSPVYGVQASLPLAPGASLVGAFGFASGDLEVGVPLLGGVSIGDSDAWMADIVVELRADAWEEQGKRLVPFAQLGGGAMHRELSVLGVTAKTTDFIVTGAVGADLPVARNISLRLLAKDHWGKADFGTIGPLTARTEDLHAVALSAGVRIAF